MCLTAGSPDVEMRSDMKIFFSYSFRPENSWVKEFVIPLIAKFGHEPVTGELLDEGGIDDEVKKKIRQSRRVI
jgi:hypothetical protein